MYRPPFMFTFPFVTVPDKKKEEPGDIMSVSAAIPTEVGIEEPYNLLTHVVIITGLVDTPWTGYAPQELKDVDHCVICLQVDRCYGEFELLDEGSRVIGTSTHGRLSLLNKDLVTDAAKVWYESTRRSSSEFQTLHHDHKVVDPGMDLSCMKPLFLRFMDAPKDALKYPHIHVFYRRYALWDKLTSTFAPFSGTT